MTREEIICMARDAGSIDSEDVIETIYRAFSSAEREACAQVCEAQQVGQPSYFEIDERIGECAAAIRERGNA